ncbi:MAG TPA: peptidoglycan-binding domain-containing protein, partial [Streptosporangiaceae bacterium]
MSTQYDTDERLATSQDNDQYTGHHAPRPANQGPSGYRIAAIAIATIIAAALVALATIGLTHNHTTTSTTPAPATSTSAPASTGASTDANPAQPTTPAHPAVVPSASVKKLQQELGQLNYYEGPVDGIMGAQTTAAIKDLQRQANLP